MSVISSRHVAENPASVRISPDSGKTIELRQLLVRLPHGSPVVAADAISFRDGERTLITGPSGSFFFFDFAVCFSSSASGLTNFTESR